MKTKYFFSFFSIIMTFYSQAALRDPELGDAYPLQAAVCDVAGIGRLINQDSNRASILVETLWIGDPTNQLEISGSAHFPMNTPFVFFATKYLSFLHLDPVYCRYFYIFNKDHHQQHHQSGNLYTLNGNESWFSALPQNSNLVSWCSNLVYTSQIATNRMAFYELIRDGYRLNPPNSRIHSDSYCTFVFFDSFCDTNFILSVWNDTNLIGRARSWVNNSYESLTRSLLPWPTNQLAPQVLE